MNISGQFRGETSKYKKIHLQNKLYLGWSCFELAYKIWKIDQNTRPHLYVEPIDFIYLFIYANVPKK
jgi:hypothetical protein